MVHSLVEELNEFTASIFWHKIMTANPRMHQRKDAGTVPGSDLAHLTAEMTCCPPSLFRVLMSLDEVSGSVLS